MGPDRVIDEGRGASCDPCRERPQRTPVCRPPAAPCHRHGRRGRRPSGASRGPATPWPDGRRRRVVAPDGARPRVAGRARRRGGRGARALRVRVLHDRPADAVGPGAPAGRHPARRDRARPRQPAPERPAGPPRRARGARPGRRRGHHADARRGRGDPRAVGPRGGRPAPPPDRRRRLGPSLRHVTLQPPARAAGGCAARGRPRQCRPHLLARTPGRDGRGARRHGRRHGQRRGAAQRRRPPAGRPRRRRRPGLGRGVRRPAGPPPAGRRRPGRVDRRDRRGRPALRPRHALRLAGAVLGPRRLVPVARGGALRRAARRRGLPRGVRRARGGRDGAAAPRRGPHARRG